LNFFDVASVVLLVDDVLYGAPAHRQVGALGTRQRMRNWKLRFLDYLYLAFTNALAFSPTDVMPLTRVAKMLMIVESLVSFVTIALIFARSVNILAS
jgi:uncharacterized membrane protein